MRFLFVAALGSASLFALACGSTTVVDDDGGGGVGGAGSECGPPPPGSGNNGCPSSYECIDGQWQDTSGACPACPEADPLEGDACVVATQECEYSVGPCLQDPAFNVYTCTNGAWELTFSDCTPETLCPDSLPIDGSDCTGWTNANDCYFDVSAWCSADQDVAYASCDVSTLTWKVEMPASCEGCLYTDAASCEADADCRWLVPGCGENPLLAAGCAPIADCAPDSCTGGATCSTYDADPCWNTLCDACSAPVSICEMIFAPGE